MAHGVPQNAARMNDVPGAENRLSVLTLQFEVVGEPDWPVLSIRVNGVNPFEGVAKNWQGFDPAEVLGASSPLAPEDDGSRVALYRCSCGEAGCGVIAPFIVASPDRKRISWVDFRDYVGVFSGPVAPEAADYEGKSWNLPDIHFDRDKYLAEVRRATNDRSWETPPRQKARLLEEHLRPMDPVLPPDLALRWVSPAWHEEGVVLSFEHAGDDSMGRYPRQQMLRLTSTQSDPAGAAADMAEQLLSASPDEWARAFGYHPR
jgi:hypothetical protein